MKRTPVMALAALVFVGYAAFQVAASTTGMRTAAQPAEPGAEYPIHKRCAVTVDSRSTAKPEYSGPANIVTGFAAPDTVVGVLIRMDPEWLVLRDGSDENWIPREKVLLVHFHQ